MSFPSSARMAWNGPWPSCPIGREPEGALRVARPPLARLLLAACLIPHYRQGPRPFCPIGQEPEAARRVARLPLVRPPRAARYSPFACRSTRPRGEAFLPDRPRAGSGIACDVSACHLSPIAARDVNRLARSSTRRLPRGVGGGAVPSRTLGRRRPVIPIPRRMLSDAVE